MARCGASFIPAHQNNLRKRRPPQFELIAGALCLDFINTLDDRYSDEPKELLQSYLDLARFDEDAGILSDAQVEHLSERCQQSPARAQRALEAALQMREAMYAVFWALVQKEPVPKAQLRILNSYAQEAARHMTLVETNGRFEWVFEDGGNEFDAPLWPLARSAADLLASDGLQFVRACAAKDCEWLFLDESKNHRRRWCDMTKCGNRAKVSSFYKRKKAASG